MARKESVTKKIISDGAFELLREQGTELSIPQVKAMFNTKFKNVVIDVKSMYRPEDFADENYCYWSF